MIQEQIVSIKPALRRNLENERYWLGVESPGSEQKKRNKKGQKGDMLQYIRRDCRRELRRHYWQKPQFQNMMQSQEDLEREQDAAHFYSEISNLVTKGKTARKKK